MMTCGPSPELVHPAAVRSTACSSRFVFVQADGQTSASCAGRRVDNYVRHIR